MTFLEIDMNKLSNNALFSIANALSNDIDAPTANGVIRIGLSANFNTICRYIQSRGLDLTAYVKCPVR